MNELDAGHDRATLEKVHSHPDVAFINPCQQRFSLMAFTILLFFFLNPVQTQRQF